MQMVKKICITFFVLWFALLAFMPKQELYYKLEQSLAKEGIKINEGSTEEGIFTFTLKNADIYVKGIKVATLEKLHFFTLLFYSKIEIDELLLEDSFKKMFPQHIQRAILSHIIVSPLQVSLNGEGSFGLVSGEMDIKKRKIHIDLIEEKEIGMIKEMLKKGKEGWYYETSF